MEELIQFDKQLLLMVNGSDSVFLMAATPYFWTM